MRICIIGLGNMGQAILDTLSEDGRFEVIGCAKGDDVNEKLEGCDGMVIAVKPQGFEALAKSITVDLSGKVAVSILAGVTIEKLVSKLGTSKVVRTMPNLALKVGKSLTLWMASDEMNGMEKEVVRGLLQTFGEEIEVSDEGLIDSLGAVTGCGAAHFAYLAEIMVKFVKEQGFSVEDAERIAKQTLIGSAEILATEEYGPEELRKRISSKGGSTEAATKYLIANDFEKIFLGALVASVKRTKELNG